MTITSTSLGECKLISYTLEDGTAIDENPIFKYVIQENMGVNEITGDFVNSTDDDVHREAGTAVPVTFEGDIFSKDYI